MIAELRADLEAGRIGRVYLVYGNEPGPMRKSIMMLRERLVDPAMAAFNHERFSGRDLEAMGPVLEACAQLPMMGAHRVVELEDPELVGKGDAAKVQFSALVDYVADPSDTTVLIVSSSGIDGRSRLVNAVKKVGVVLKFEPFRKDRDAVAFVQDLAQEAGQSISARVVQRLVARVGTQRSALMVALEQSALHAGPGQSIGEADVDAVTQDSREAVIFELTDAVGMGQRDRALTVLSRLFHETTGGEIGQANMVLAMLIRQFRLVLLAKAARADPEQIQERTGVPPFVAKKLAQQARGTDAERLTRAYRGLARLDRDLKGGSAAVVRGPLVALQRWILEVCGALPTAAPRI